MSVKNAISAIVLTSIDSSTFSGAYQAIDPAGLDHPCFLLRIINNSNTDITVSADGVHDHDFVPKNTIAQIEFQTNSQPNNNMALVPKGTIFYVKGSAGAGKVYLAGYYQFRQN